jgi:hypothetical protein
MSGPLVSGDDVPLGDHVRRLARAWPAVAVGALAGLAVGLVDVALTAPVYRSTTSILVADAPAYLVDRGQPSAKRFSMDTEAQRVTSARILDAVGRAVGDPAPADHLDVSAVPNTKVLRVTYRSRGEEAATIGSERAAAAYLRIRTQSLETRRDARVEAINQELRTLNDRLDATATSRSSASAQRVRRAAISRRIAERQAEIRAVEAASVYPGEIVRRRELSPGMRHNKSVPVTGGLALGALAGAAVFGLRASRLRAADDVTRAVPGPAVAVAPPGVPRALDPVASRLAGDPGLYVVAPVDGAGSGSGSAVARALATRLSRSGRPTLLHEHLDPHRDDAETAQIVRGLRRPGTTVLLVAPRITTATGRFLATLTDGTVLVAPRGAGVRDLTAAARHLTDVGATLEGVVLTPRQDTTEPRRRGGAR